MYASSAAGRADKVVDKTTVAVCVSNTSNWVLVPSASPDPVASNEPEKCMHARGTRALKK